MTGAPSGEGIGQTSPYGIRNHRDSAEVPVPSSRVVPTSMGGSPYVLV